MDARASSAARLAGSDDPDKPSVIAVGIAVTVKHA
jgi:hypothetical protein